MSLCVYKLVRQAQMFCIYCIVLYGCTVLVFVLLANLVAEAPGLHFGKKLSNLLSNRKALNFSPPKTMD